MEELYNKKWQILMVVAIGTLMVPINASIVNIALPNITEYFGVTVALSQWILTAYLMSLLSLVLFFGRIGDFYGHEKLYMLGLCIFLISSLLCSISPSILGLVMFRVMQGVGAAMMISVSMGIVKKSFPRSELGRSLGIYAVAISIGLSLGPAIGGFLDTLGGWRTVFLVNIPIGILSLILCYFILNRPGGEEAKWDIYGTLLQFICLFSVVYGLSYIEISGLDLQAYLIGLVALITLFIFIWNENRVEYPLLNLSFFRNRKFSAYNLALFFNYLSTYMILFIMPFYLQKVLHLKTNIIGLILTTAPLIMIFLAPISGILSDKFGSRYPAFFGSIISGLALFSMNQLTIFSSLTDVILRFALLGIGNAFFQSPNNRAIMAVIPSSLSGMASSIVITMRNLGMVFAVCIASLLLYTTISPGVLQSFQLFNLVAYNFTTGMHLVVTLGGTLSFLMAILSLIKDKRNKME